MYNSIQHFGEFGVKKIEKKVKDFISNQKDLADLVLGLQEDIFELGRNILQEVLEDIDENLRTSGVRKKEWEVVRKDAASILTSFGLLRYNKTYFKLKKGGDRKYLVDNIVGIKPHDRVSSDVVINATEEAIESSYKKGGVNATFVGEITKQSVMNKIHSVEVKQPDVVVNEKKDINILYIEADEDHVALQGKNFKKENTEKTRRISMPRLVYVHEGIDHEKSTGKRKVLKNTRYFGGEYKNSEILWLEVAEYIDEVYKMDSVDVIYLSGDGAAWIKQGLDWIPKSKFVLDNYHLNKYIKEATAHLDDEAITQGLRDGLDEADKDLVKRVFDKILEKTEIETKQNAVKDARRYILNNWVGIEIKLDNFNIVGCSAEGHVSHIYSDRLSSRPKGWSTKGADQMSQLRVFKKNGGKVYDLVMAQKKKEKRIQNQQLQDELVRGLRTEAKRYENTWSSNLTVIQKGQKTALYKGLRNIIGI
jgi:hypothetical protein